MSDLEQSRELAAGDIERLRRTVSAGDERYSHQLVAPQLLSAHPQSTWAERCYHVLHAGPELMINAGRAVYPYAGRCTAFANVRLAGVQHAVRADQPFTIGEDPDRPDLGGLRIEVVRPLEEIRLQLDEPGAPVSYDLTFTARSPAIPTLPNTIESGRELVTDYMNFYQSGVYTGTVSVEGESIQIGPRAGFRDRGWGIRKHEGAPRRGFVLFGALEFPDQALHLLLYETASGRRAFTDGWLVGASGVTDTVVGAEHDLELDGTLLRNGTVELTFASGARRTLSLEIETRLFLSAGGYSAHPERLPLGHARYDVRDPEVVAFLDGQNDNGGRFRLDGVEGHGFIETGIGTHPRYRPGG